MNRVLGMGKFIKICLLNCFCMAGGYLVIQRYRRFWFFFIFFFLICLFFIYGFPVDRFCHAPYLMAVSFIILPFLDLTILNLLKKTLPVTFDLQKNKPHTGCMVLLFLLQSGSIISLNILSAMGMTTTHTLLVTSPNMRPQLQMNDLLGTRSWAWRPKRIGEKGLRRGDIVLYKISDQYFALRRIIALPGETLTLDDGIAVINGQKLKADILGSMDFPTEEGVDRQGKLKTEFMENGRNYRIIARSHLKTEDMGEDVLYHVPEGHIAVLSDTRPFVLDKALENVMVIPVEAVTSYAVNIVPTSNLLSLPQLVE